LYSARQAQCLRLDFPIRRTSHCIRNARWNPATAACYPEAAAAGSCSVVRGGAVCSACLPGIVGSIQAMETIKLILGAGDSLAGRLLLFDALGMKFRELKLRKNPDCPMWRKKNRTIHQLIDYYEFCGVPRRRSSPRRICKFRKMTPREPAVTAGSRATTFIF